MNVRGKLQTVDQPLVMGILNITPDSFYEGSRITTTATCIQKAGQMLEEGATFLDIGGQSTRPGAPQLNAKEERNRVIPIIKALMKEFPEALLSVDTYYSEVAHAAVEYGAVMINDISSGEMDTDMIPIIGRLQVPYIAMHMQGTPANMQKKPHYDNLVQEVFDYFVQKMEICQQAGIHDLILDPGFGFGKTMAHNYSLIKHLSYFQKLGKPLLIGLSRKSMIYKLLETHADKALNGTTALHMLALQQGAQILRVHDVRPAMEVIQLWEYYQKQA